MDRPSGGPLRVSGDVLAQTATQAPLAMGVTAVVNFTPSSTELASPWPSLPSNELPEEDAVESTIRARERWSRIVDEQERV
jgi:hypothetical protein